MIFCFIFQFPDYSRSFFTFPNSKIFLFSAFPRPQNKKSIRIFLLLITMLFPELGTKIPLLAIQTIEEGIRNLFLLPQVAFAEVLKFLTSLTNFFCKYFDLKWQSSRLINFFSLMGFCFPLQTNKNIICTRMSGFKYFQGPQKSWRGNHEYSSIFKNLHKFRILQNKCTALYGKWRKMWTVAFIQVFFPKYLMKHALYFKLLSPNQDEVSFVRDGGW